MTTITNGLPLILNRLLFFFGSLAAQVASSVTYSAVQRIAGLPWSRTSGEFGSQFGQVRPFKQDQLELLSFTPSIQLTPRSFDDVINRVFALLFFLVCHHLNFAIQVVEGIATRNPFFKATIEINHIGVTHILQGKSG